MQAAIKVVYKLFCKLKWHLYYKFLFFNIPNLYFNIVEISGVIQI